MVKNIEIYFLTTWQHYRNFCHGQPWKMYPCTHRRTHTHMRARRERERERERERSKTCRVRSSLATCPLCHVGTRFKFWLDFFLPLFVVTCSVVCERTCGAPMFGFGNWWQSLWTNGCLELYYLKVLSIGFSWSTCVGFKESLCRQRCYSRNYLKIGPVRAWSRLSQRVNQVDQHTKRRICTERDQVIPWYGKHCQLRFVY